MAQELINFLYGIKENIPQVPRGYLDKAKFIGSCLDNIDVTRSQNFQDIWAAYENKFINDGFFVEFGATNGIDGSNTYFLEQELFWQGIVAEPNPAWHPQLNKNRLITRTKIVDKCVYTESGKQLEFVVTDEPDLATIKGYGLNDEHEEKRKNGKLITVETISLYDMLISKKAPRFIEYMSVDTEGSEYDILKAFFDRNDKYKIKCITVEHNFNEVNRNNLFSLLSSQGYVRKFTDISRWDDFYIKE